LHELAYPDFAKQHTEQRRGQLGEAYHHDGTVLDLQLRGEYLYAACGPKGFIAYDVANIDNKGFSERIITAPVSPIGQKLFRPDALRDQRLHALHDGDRPDAAGAIRPTKRATPSTRSTSTSTLPTPKRA
jgi:hypothetical protein